MLSFWSGKRQWMVGRCIVPTHSESSSWYTSRSIWTYIHLNSELLIKNMCRTMLKKPVYKATMTIQDSIGSLYDECRRACISFAAAFEVHGKTLKRELNRLYDHDGHDISLLMLVLMKGHKECAKLLMKYNIDCGLGRCVIILCIILYRSGRDRIKRFGIHASI